jgi:hypothetical protein
MRSRSLPFVGVALLACSEMITAPAPASVSPSAYSLAAADERIRFEHLAEGEEIHARVHAYGCFYDDSLTLVFRTVDLAELEADSEMAVRVSVVRRSYATGRRPLPPSTVSRTVDTVSRTVDAAALISLDEFVNRYRDPPINICTSQSDLELSLYRRGELVQREVLHLSSCQLEEHLPVTFWSLAYED